MNDDNKKELARRAVACKHWRHEWIPDLDDPATLGRLRALVRGVVDFRAVGGTLAGRRVAALEAAP